MPRFATLRFAAALAGTSLRASFALRAAFWLQAVLMLLNNLAFFTMWLIFFNRFDQVGDWRLEDVAIVFGIVAAGFGLAHVLYGGIGSLATMILNGDLDPLLVQPKSALLQSVGSRSNASAWGDLATGAGFLAVTGNLELQMLPLVLLAVIASAVTFVSAFVVFHCLAFWLGRVETVSRQLSEFTLTFSLYPRPLFGGPLRIVLFTILPAGIIGWLPAELVREPDMVAAGLCLLGAAGAMVVASTVFARGLRHYESGSRFGVRG